jgi:Sulfotransferase family
MSTPPAPPPSPIGPSKRLVREGLQRLLTKIFSHHEGRQLLFDAVRGFRSPHETLPPLAAPPYMDVAGAVPATAAAPPVFITARFRSGSTLVWQLFRAIPTATAFYEPHNERRWFDPASRGGAVDQTHLGVDDYWREYDGMGALAQWYHEEWADRHFYMGEDFSDHDMRLFIAHLIAQAPQRPVLQFNHVDFRLPWLRRQFPAARLLHLYRHPRDQWLSCLLRPGEVPRNVTTAEFWRYDHFYLLRWARDLAFQFPFLDPRHEPHPYRIFYLLWRLSHHYGSAYAHASVAFEDLVARPRAVIAGLLEAAEWPDVDLDPLVGLVRPARSGGWADFAPASWFVAHEAACEQILARALGPLTPLD